MGKVVKYSVPLPVILMGILLIRAVTLPGFVKGWEMYLNPVWSVLLDPEVWTTGTPIAELAASGPGLAFIVFPEALSLMPLPGFFSVLFFLMLLLLGIDSAFSLAEALNAAILDQYKQVKIAKVSITVCLAALIAGIIYTTRAGLYFLDIVDHFVTSYNLLLVGIFQTILGGWIYGAEKLRRYINQVSDWQIGKWWNVSIKYIIPLVLTTLLVTQFYKDIKIPCDKLIRPVELPFLQPLNQSTDS